MRNDIAEATESIRLASEEDFRQVVELYQEKLADFNIQFRLMNRFQP
jgi:anti-sigma-K factor RskA